MHQKHPLRFNCGLLQYGTVSGLRFGARHGKISPVVQKDILVIHIGENLVQPNSEILVKVFNASISLTKQNKKNNDKNDN